MSQATAGNDAPVDRPATRETRTESARSRLIAAAVESFAAKGFHGTTTRDIASATGMSPAALYVHYKSKEELLYLISRSGHDVTLQLVRDGVASSDDPAEQLLAIIRGFVVYHARGHTSARVVNYELAALSPEHYEEIIAIRRAIDREMRLLVEAGVAGGVFHTSNPRMTALALLSLGIDVARWYRDEGEWSDKDIADHYCELALRIVGARR
ncbi:TetR/AcrR family transcriptional regulator [Microtetraspora sp. NBRC 16547]|uniref:TetR/AcrR family transcriptional regulator n=1 Tax=Microtetraspora sp. NBRC 16547 TaxID=3030993 RepID=UPI0024A05C18|nr:TetR/AcrR family transcriptional regulator [Microtetraspora sp. NBRC 16547]GLW99372.1 TetR family transcriptional regulator [Microtetraspora sp. NBRC 16547]